MPCAAWALHHPAHVRQTSSMTRSPKKASTLMKHFMVLPFLPVIPQRRLRTSCGISQIEVTFDIDASGILNISAANNMTGKLNHHCSHLLSMPAIKDTGTISGMNVHRIKCPKYSKYSNYMSTTLHQITSTSQKSSPGQGAHIHQAVQMIQPCCSAVHPG
jgi:hypothetical protein